MAVHQFHPVLNRSIEVSLQYGSHAFGGKRFAGHAVCDPLVDNFSERGDFDWLYKNLIRLRTDDGQCLVQLWVPAEYYRYCFRVGVPHGTDDGETITRMRPLKVGKQHVESFRRDPAESRAHIPHCHYIQPLASHPP